MAEAWDESAEICRINGKLNLGTPPHTEPQLAYKATA
jgi:hypothetical protein